MQPSPCSDSPPPAPSVRVPAGMTPDEKVAFAARFPVHVGVDTGKSFHRLVARGPDGRRTKAVRVDVSRGSFNAADAFLRETFGVAPEQVLIGLEFAGHHGQTFTEYLRAKGYAVVAVLPSVTKKLKEVEDNSPRKDDAKDAAQICKLLASGLYVGVAQLSESVAEMRVLATERHRLAVEATRLKNRLHGALDVAWPEFAGQFSDLAKATPLALLRRWSVPTDLTSAAPRAVAALVKTVSLNHVGTERVAQLVASARETVGVRAATEARRSEIQRVLARLDVVREHAGAVEARLAELVAAHPGARALATVPEVSVVCAATLVSELGTPETYMSPRQVLKLAGMKLALKVRNGGARTSAMCAIARRLVPMLLHVMQSGEPFDRAKWRAGRAGALAVTPYREGAAA